MEQHTGIMAHDGYAEHSHEVRPDHHGVSRTWTGLAAEPKGVQDVVRGRFPGGKSNLTGPALAAARIAADTGALNRLAELLRASPRLEDADLIDVLFDIVGQTGRITDQDGLDTEDDPAAQARRDALVPWACRECGTEVMAPGDEPEHPEWCSSRPEQRDDADLTADAMKALEDRILAAVPGVRRDDVQDWISDLLDLAPGQALTPEAALDTARRVLAVDQGAATVTKGDVIRIVPERGPERVMTVAHVEHRIITLTENSAAWEVVPGEVMTVDARSADEAVRAAIAEAGETANGRGYEPDPNQYYWARRAGTRGPWQRIPV